MGVLVPPEVDLSLQQLLLDGVALLSDLRLHLRVGVVHWTVVVADDCKKRNVFTLLKTTLGILVFAL